MCAIISASGAYDLNALSWENLWTPQEGAAREARALASPLSHVSADSKPHLILHSDDYTAVDVQQAIDMAEALRRAGIHHKFIRWTDRGHMGITDEVAAEARAFVDEHENSN